MPSLTKYVPIILVNAQTPAIARGNIIIVSEFSIKNIEAKTGKTIKNVCDARKRGLKKTYEMNQLRIKNIETSAFDFKSYNISHNFTIGAGVGENVSKRVVSPSSIFSQGFDTRLFNEPTEKNRNLFRRSVGEEMALH